MILTEEQREAIKLAMKYIARWPFAYKELQAMIDSSEHIREPPKMVGFDLVARIRELEAENVQLLAALDESERVVAHKTKSAAHWYDEHLQARADRVQTRRVVEQQAARIKELESSLDEAEALTKKNADLMNAYLARIAELEDALVEGLTNFLHYRASCYDPARRCPYAKECDDCSTWDACGHVEKFRSEARQRLQAEGKIGPEDAKPHCWQITEERKAAIDRSMRFLSWANAKTNDPGTEIDLAVLRAMLTEAGQ